MSDDATRLAGRVDALEAQLAYQDETIETLNQTITAQWTAIDALKRQIARLTERLEEATDGAAPVDRPPPHY